jgi:hypothetical protein
MGRQREPGRWAISALASLAAGTACFTLALLVQAAAFAIVFGEQVDRVPRGAGLPLGLAAGATVAVLTWRGITTRWHRVPRGGATRWGR